MGNKARRTKDSFQERLVLGLATGNVAIEGLLDGAKTLLVALVHHLANGACLAILRDEKQARQISLELATFVEGRLLTYFPSLQLVANPASYCAHQQRAATLAHLCLGDNLLVVTSRGALREPTPSPAIFRENIFAIAQGQSWEREVLLEKIGQSAYRKVALVSEIGDFSVRGNIIDIFVPLYPHPLRIEFDGNDIESLRFFEKDSQRSREHITSFYFSPAAEMVIGERERERAGAIIKERAYNLSLDASARERILLEARRGNGAELPFSWRHFFLPPESRGTLLDFFAQRAPLIGVDCDVEKGIDEMGIAEDALLPLGEDGDFILVTHEEAFLSPQQQETMLAGHPKLFLNTSPQTISTRFAVPNSPFVLIREGIKEKTIEALVQQIRLTLGRGEDVLYFAPAADALSRITGLLESYSLYPTTLSSNLMEIFERPASGNFFLCEGRLKESFFFQDRLLLSDESLWGKRPSRNSKRGPVAKGMFLRSFSEIKEGDYLVHIQHGIGIYRGLQSLSVDGITNDFLLIEYLENGRLYLPVSRLELVQRYIGVDGVKPKLDKLGSRNWETAKRKAKAAVAEIAKDLMEVYARRDVLTRTPAEPLDDAYEKFCREFPYEETADQLAAIAAINEDMEANKPMDRLLCGDAGFGKTEVAIRAAYRAVFSGRQVVLIAPTTILSEQHFATFSERFRNYPVRIESLNRFKHPNAQRRIVADFNRGVVDVLIGTHRVLQQDILPKNLGLLIIDEEQSFGVIQKEKLKKLKTDVDILSLSATPIPRTLHLALVGIRDLSLINSPPVNRLPVSSFSFDFDEGLLAAALDFEMTRGGQVFFVHDRIASIAAVVRLVKKLAPQSRVAVVHGQLSVGEVEARMAMFIRKEVDILVCTTIIAAGIDIPSANTIIINRADRLGLAQLYQLRGRVGRSFVEGFAYFVTPKSTTSNARNRIAAILNTPMKGAGFQIASYDLELRGAGNILGISQSGHITTVGYELYTQMMEEAVRELKGEVSFSKPEVNPEINLGIEAYIPSSFIPDVSMRIGIYKRLSLVEGQMELADIRAELRDIHGTLPKQIENLLAAVSLKNTLKQIGADKMTYNQGILQITFVWGSFPSREKIANLQKIFKGVGIKSPDILAIPLLEKESDGLQTKIASVLELLAK